VKRPQQRAVARERGRCRERDVRQQIGVPLGDPDRKRAAAPGGDDGTGDRPRSGGRARPAVRRSAAPRQREDPAGERD
jgi:hypothetical protein